MLHIIKNIIFNDNRNYIKNIIVQTDRNYIKNIIIQTMSLGIYIIKAIII